MGEVIELLPRRRAVRKQVRSGVKFDANRLLREHDANEEVRHRARDLAAVCSGAPLATGLRRCGRRFVMTWLSR